MPWYPHSAHVFGLVPCVFHYQLHTSCVTYHQELFCSFLHISLNSVLQQNYILQINPLEASSEDRKRGGGHKTGGSGEIRTIKDEENGNKGKMAERPEEMNKKKRNEEEPKKRKERLQFCAGVQFQLP